MMLLIIPFRGASEADIGPERRESKERAVTLKLFLSHVIPTSVVSGLSQSSEPQLQRELLPCDQQDMTSTAEREAFDDLGRAGKNVSSRTEP